jgi:protein-tyrosine-phosphatase/DNA-binding transcriptional ArsR family regulator
VPEGHLQTEPAVGTTPEDAPAITSSLDALHLFIYSGNMEMFSASNAFSALGHPGRLAVFRMLMRFAPRGARPTEIADALAMKQNTLSHHLAGLTASGLVVFERRGRSLYYAVDLHAVETLVGYLALDVGRARPELLASLLPAPKDAEIRDTVFKALFICTGNSARSIFAEALLRDLGKGRFQTFSAGMHPNAEVNPFALEILKRNGHDASGLRPKHVAEFQRPDSVTMDFVFTVCDAAAGEECPPWSGRPITGHWGLPDPVKAPGNDAEKALVFARTYAAIRRWITTFVELPIETLGRISLQARVDAIELDLEAKA